MRGRAPVDVDEIEEADRRQLVSTLTSPLTGPRGGMAVSITMRGARNSFEFAALKPGPYVYHSTCSLDSASRFAVADDARFSHA